MLPPDDALEFLSALTHARGPSGFEAAVQAVWADRVRGLADRLDSDAYGNVWAVLEPRRAANDGHVPTVMITGHADEIGLMVNYIESSGLLRVVPIGGVDAGMLSGRRVVVHADAGMLAGVIGAVPIHLKDKKDAPQATKIDEVFVDCGFMSEAEAAARVRVGTPVTLADAYQRLTERRAVSRAFDNRIGIYAAAECLRRVAAQREALLVRLVALSTVQEEIGAVGAGFATRQIDPDCAFCIDVTHATDVPGISQARHGKVTLGGGPSVTHGTANHPELVGRIVSVAAARKITLQHEASSRYTGTDTDTIYQATRGIPSALLSLPNRYMHTPAEMIDLQDLEQLVELLTAVILDLKPDDRFRAVRF